MLFRSSNEAELFQLATESQKQVQAITRETNEKTSLNEQAYLLQSVHRTLEQLGEHQSFFHRSTTSNAGPVRCFVYGAQVGYSSTSSGEHVPEDLIIHLMLFDDVILLVCLEAATPRIYATFHLLSVRLEAMETSSGTHGISLVAIGARESIQVATVEERQKIMETVLKLQQRLFLQRMLVGSPSLPDEGQESEDSDELPKIAQPMQAVALEQRALRSQTEKKIAQLSTTLKDNLNQIELLNKQLLA